MSLEQYYLLLLAGLARFKWRGADLTSTFIDTASR